MGNPSLGKITEFRNSELRSGAGIVPLRNLSKQ